MTSLVDRPLKSDPDIFETEHRLRQGNYMRGETRNLRNLLEDDLALVASLDLQMDFIITELERLYREGLRDYGDPITVDGKYEVEVREDRGKTPCPWGDRFFAPKTVVSARNLENGTILKYSLLGLHMIKRHGFFQGAQSPFRIEPSLLKKFFDL